MDSGAINISTGPVKISTAVKAALAADPIPHRAESFLETYTGVTALLCDAFHVKQSFLLTGSGTLANEAMLYQIKQIEGRGLILSNGEFGNRLISQADRIGLDYSVYSKPWGERLPLEDINRLIAETLPAWMLFVHCETSTGMVNDLDALATLANSHGCSCFTDCMSTVGTRAIDLSKITMATASSGKGLASIPGLAIVFSNIEAGSGTDIPSYVDLGLYAQKAGVPFTISSNQVTALLASLKQKLVTCHYTLLETYRQKITALLGDAMLTPFNQTPSFVFTLVPPDEEYQECIEQLTRSGLTFSYESEYLRKRRWIQIALFNYYQEEDLQQVVNSLEKLRALSY
jgi:aspartate aminotransferase-like enzyme